MSNWSADTWDFPLLTLPLTLNQMQLYYWIYYRKDWGNSEVPKTSQDGKFCVPMSQNLLGAAVLCFQRIPSPSWQFSGINSTCSSSFLGWGWLLCFPGSANNPFLNNPTEADEEKRSSVNQKEVKWVELAQNIPK